MSTHLSKMLKQHEKYSRSGLSKWGKRVRLQSRLDEATLAVSASLRDMIDLSAPMTDDEISTLELASAWAKVDPPPPCATHNRLVSYAFTDQIRDLAVKRSSEDSKSAAGQPPPRNRKEKKAAKRTLRFALGGYVAELNTLLTKRI